MTAITAKHVLQYARRHLACDAGIEWLKTQPEDTALAVLIDTCPKPVWVEWLVIKLGVSIETLPQENYQGFLAQWDALAAASGGLLTDRVKSLVAMLATGDAFQMDVALKEMNMSIAYHEGCVRWLTYLYNFAQRGEPASTNPFHAKVTALLDDRYRLEFSKRVDVSAVEAALKEVLALE